MNTARAAIFAGAPERLDLREMPLPELRPGETLVRVLGCTLCGSDLHTFDGRRRVAVPTILGHEIVGEVVALEPAEGATPTPAFQLGDRVTWAIVASCGDCFYCRRQLPQKCLRSVKYGHEAIATGREWYGGLADYCLLAPGTFVARLPDELPLSVACPASCATATVAAAIEAAGELRDRSVGLLGAGTLGLTAAAMARAAGASHVVCIDPQTDRRERALRFGATHVGAPEFLGDVRASAGLTQGFDVVVELSGSNAAFQSAWPTVRLGGTIVLVGAVFPSADIGVSLEQIVRRQLTIRGIHNYAPRHLRTALEFLAHEHRRTPFHELVSEWYRLEEIDKAFAAARTPAAVRIGIMP